MSSFDDWLHSDADRVSTHSESCYEYHPKCAALIAISVERARIRNRVLALIIIACAIVLISPSFADARPLKHCQRLDLSPKQAIQCAFPKQHRAKALRVASCESTALAPKRLHRKRNLGRWAKNRQYIGIFQMGIRERRAYGWYDVGDPAIIQAKSARQLHKARGWQPWSCA